VTLNIVAIYPDLLGTYGDTGNAMILAKRALWRGIDASLTLAKSTDPLPNGDLYCLGGGEDGPQVLAAEQLTSDGTLTRAAESGAVIFGVCAGFQILGVSFPGDRGSAHEGLGLIDVVTVKGTGQRAVGELAATVATVEQGGLGLPDLTGFENHGGVTTLGPASAPLGTTLIGVGNGGGDASEGAVQDNVICTYLHGPVLARNPALADLLLARALHVEELAPLNDERELLLHRERLDAAMQAKNREGSARQP
jgi:CobQ-like glutamine amidotransferase family enzyme